MRCLLGLTVVFFSMQSFAKEVQNGFKIESEFTYESSLKKMKSKSEFILAANHKAWTTLAQPKDGVALLGRVTSSDKKSISLEYIVVDTSQANAVISTPAIIARLGEKAQIEVGSNDSKEKVVVSLLATRTEYTIKQ
jgi:hypothetical protein